MTKELTAAFALAATLITDTPKYEPPYPPAHATYTVLECYPVQVPFNPSPEVKI